MLRILCIGILILLISCTSETGVKNKVPKKGSDSEPSVSETALKITDNKYLIQILPEEPSRDSTLFLISRGFELSAAEVQWLVNGVPVIVQTPNQFNLSRAQKNDTIQVRAIIEGKEILSNTIIVKNSPPEITRVKIMPEVFRPGDKLYVDVEGRDMDGDEIVFLYEWLKNDETVSRDKELTTPVKRGDRIHVKITPFDGEDYGRTVTLYREIKNTPPIIIGYKEIKDENFFLLQLNASDPDGDPLTYSLKEAPQGMTIDETGLITWNIPPDFKGKAKIIVSVSDGNGGEALQSFEIKVE